MHVLWQYRSTKFAATVLAIFSVVCAQIPLFNYLGFEFSALTALVGFFVLGYWTLDVGKELTSHNSIQAKQTLRRILLGSQSLLLIPLAIMSFNGFFVKNCSWLHGTAFFLLLVIPSVLLASALAIFLLATDLRWKKSWFTLIGIVTLLHIVWVTMTRPQVFAFNPILGYFPGFTYDETLAVEGRLLVYRLSTILLSMLLIDGAFILTERRRNGTLQRWTLLVPVGSIIVLTGFYFYSNRLSLSSSEAYVEAELAGVRETPHFSIHYPAETLKPDEVDRLAAYHEFLFDKLTSRLAVHPSYRIHVFIYSTAAQKGRLIGAAGTTISKPWLHQIHVNAADINGVLKHELVHVLASEFGLPVLGIATNAGLIEGAAVALEETAFDRPVHETASQIFAIGLKPNVESLFSFTGFAQAAPSVSYTVAGSFCKYLMDTYGMEKFKRVYGGGAYVATYGKRLVDLIADWKAILSPAIVNENEKVRAAYIFTRRSIFGKECARVIANINKRTRDLLNSKQYESALESADESLRLSSNADALQQKTFALVRMGRYDDAVKIGAASFKDTVMSASLLPMRLTLGDAHWGLGERKEADSAYRLLRAIHLSPAWDETCALRMAIVEDSAMSVLMRPLMLTDLNDTLRINVLTDALSSISMTASQRGLVALVLIRAWNARGDYRRVADIVNDNPPPKDSLLQFARWRALALAWFAMNNFDAAKDSFRQALALAQDDAQRREVEDWLERCENTDVWSPITK